MSRDFILVLISLIIWGIGEGTFMNFQPLYLQELGASPVTIGGILGAVGLAWTIVHIPAGYLADRIGRRKIMWGAWATGIIATGFMASTQNLGLFTVGLILYSLTLFVVAPLNSYLTNARKELTVEQAMTFTTAGFYIGGILGPLIGGWVANNYGLRTNFLVAFVFFVISGIIILFIKPQPIEKRSPNPTDALLKNNRFIAYLPLIFVFFFVLNFSQPLAPNYLQNQRGISIGTIGILTSIMNLGNAGLNILFGIIPVRAGLLIGQTAIGLFSLLVWRSTGLPLLVIAYFFSGGFRATRSLLIAQVQKLVESSNLGLAYGITETVAGSALMFVPPIVGVLYAKEPSLIFSVSLALIFPLILFTLIRRKMPWNI
jgi:MFS family permease